MQNKQLKPILSYFYGSCLEELRKTIANISRGRTPPSSGLNEKSPRCNKRMLMLKYGGGIEELVTITERKKI